MKMFNIKGIIIVIAVLIAVQLASAFIISPILGPIVVDTVNKLSGTKISIEKTVIWPLTLSCSLEGIKVFDPDDSSKRIAVIKDADLRLSPLGLLANRIVIAKINISGAEINIKGEPDGSFNVSKLAKAKEAGAQERPGILERFKPKGDWFTRIYDAIKKKAQKKPAIKAAKKEKEVKELPRGRKVLFVKPRDKYLFEIKDFSISNAKFNIEIDSQMIDVDDASFYFSNLALDPAEGLKFNRMGIKGIISQSGSKYGAFDMFYEEKTIQSKYSLEFNFSCRDVDLTKVQFFYQDSLPVTFQKGLISVKSYTKIIGDEINSEDSLELKDHLISSSNNADMIAFIPMPVICDALNKINPVDMKFKITGTLDKPQFKGFEDVLLKIITPYVADIKNDIANKGINALNKFLNKNSNADNAGTTSSSEENSLSDTLKSLQSAFGVKEKK